MSEGQAREGMGDSRKVYASVLRDPGRFAEAEEAEAEARAARVNSSAATACARG